MKILTILPIRLLLLSTLGLTSAQAAPLPVVDPSPTSDRAAGLTSELVPEIQAGIQGRSFGLQSQADGQAFIGGGPDYAVEFADGGFELTPAFGREALRDYPLRFQLESVRRGGAFDLVAPGRRPTAAGTNVTYRHSAGFSEHYEVRREGVYQSFVFASRPGGTGDLVVRGALDTDLSVAPRGGGLVLSAEGVGELTYGAVTGVDAAGQTVPGSLRYDGVGVELVLPADFIDNALYPLTLDPLVGGVVAVATSNDEADPDVAYDASTDLYLVVWERAFSGTVFEVRCQRVSTSGALVGGTIFLTSGGNVKLNPTVANCNLSDKFLVAWQEGESIFGPWDIVAATVDVAGAVSAGELIVANDAANEIDPDAGGEAVALEDDVLLVWNQVGGGIRGAQITVPTLAFDPYVVNKFTISTGSSDSRPAITKSGGALGYYLVAYQKFFSSPAPGDHDLWARLVDRNGNLLTTETVVHTSTGPNEEEVDVAGNGASKFMLAWESEASLDSGDRDVYCKTATFNGNSLVVDTALAEPVAHDFGDDEFGPAIGWAGGKYMIAWIDHRANLTYDIYAVGVNPNTCLACETQFLVDGPAGVTSLEMTSELSGAAGEGDRLLLVYEEASTLPPFVSDVMARRIEAFGSGGAVSNLGGSCGGGGTISASGPSALGNPDFSIGLSGADPTATVAILNLGSAGAPIACGPCVWNPFQRTFSQPLVGGAASQSIPVPCSLGLLGVPVPFQWTVFPTTATPCSLFDNVSVSDRLQVNLGN